MDNMEKQKKIDIFEIIALASAAVSLILAILGTTLTCVCSAKKTWSKKSALSILKMEHQMSFTCIISIIAIIFAVVAIVTAVIALSKNRKSIMAVISLAVGVFAALYAFIPMVTICGYNCSLESSFENSLNKQIGGSIDNWGSLFD